jgi:hypothetical protein
LSIDEYAYSGVAANLKLALAYGMVFNEMLRYTDFLKISAFTMGVSTLDYNATGAVYNTTGLLFKMYGDHLGSISPRSRREPESSLRVAGPRFGNGDRERGSDYRSR